MTFTDAGTACAFVAVGRVVAAHLGGHRARA